MTFIHGTLGFAESVLLQNPVTQIFMLVLKIKGSGLNINTAMESRLYDYPTVVSTIDNKVSLATMNENSKPQG